MTQSPAPVRIGMIGCGGRLRHVADVLLKAASGRIRISALHDPDPLSVATARQEFGEDIAVCDTEDTLVARPDVDWVFVGSPNIHHARQAILALRAGKHVFCEKPLATSLEDALAVRDAVRETGRTFAFGLVLRYSPHYRKVHEIVSSGAFGRIISFEFNETLSFNHGGYIFGNWRRRRAEAGTHLLEKCCHDLDLANWIVGSKPRCAASFGGRDFFTPDNAGHSDRLGLDSSGKPAYRGWPDPHGVDPFSPGADIMDNQVAILEYENGVRATFHTNCNSGLPERRFYICGTEGALRADSQAGVIEWQRIGHAPVLEKIDTGSTRSHAGGDDAMAEGLVRTLLDGEPPLAGVDDGVLAAATAFLVDDAMDHRRVSDVRKFGIGI